MCKKPYRRQHQHQHSDWTPAVNLSRISSNPRQTSKLSMGMHSQINIPSQALPKQKKIPLLRTLLQSLPQPEEVQTQRDVAQTVHQPDPLLGLQLGIETGDHHSGATARLQTETASSGDRLLRWYAYRLCLHLYMQMFVSKLCLHTVLLTVINNMCLSGVTHRPAYSCRFSHTSWTKPFLHDV